jgi:hypothetical protein
VILETQEVVARIISLVDRNRDGSLDRSEIVSFVDELQRGLVKPALSSARASSNLAAVPTAREFKSLVNGALVEAAREMGLTLVSVEGSRYPAVAELRPDRDELGIALGPTAEQAAIRRELTMRVAEKLSGDPRWPSELTLEVENPDAPSGADLISVRLTNDQGQEETVVLDIITGEGILKARIARNYVSSVLGISVEEVVSRGLRTLDLLSTRLRAAGLVAG